MALVARPMRLSDLSFSRSLLLRKNWEFSCLEGGLPQGALVEVSGPPGGGKTELVLKLISEHPGIKVAWVEESLTIYPGAFAQQKVSLQRVLFIETTRYLWAVHQILRSQLFGMVILSARVANEVERRRLQIAAEKASASVILLAEQATGQGSWPIAVQLSVRRSQQTGMTLMEVIKYRGLRQCENLSSR